MAVIILPFHVKIESSGGFSSHDKEKIAELQVKFNKGAMVPQVSVLLKGRCSFYVEMCECFLDTFGF